MRRYWWFVWVKVAVLAVVLLVGYFAVKNTVNALIEPYVLETPRETVSATEPSEGDSEEEPEEANIVDRVMGWVENVLDVQLDYENMIFDYANDYAKEMIEQSDDERNLTNQ